MPWLFPSVEFFSISSELYEHILIDVIFSMKLGFWQERVFGSQLKSSEKIITVNVRG